MLSQEIRRQFLSYFNKKGHTLVPSSPVLPHDDPTLLFVNAGMNQFKDVFLGKSQRDYSRAATVQKCIRVGGKHNDLENVGHTSRHLTFFEMLGNFSFGDYFKKEAIDFGFQVTTEVFLLDPTFLYATIFYEDEEAYELWKKYLPVERIIRMGEKDNFWSMGEVGPCGPCSELLYDRGSSFGNAISPAEDITGERFFEFWNLVFMQYNKTAEGTLEPLPKKSVDTGSGLERVALLKKGGRSLFETDILRGLIAEIENRFHLVYDPENSSTRSCFHVIADHLRSLAFAISDGVQPSNIERGYVLRKLLRRAVRYGKQLGQREPFLAKLLPRLVAIMGEDYPELLSAQTRIADILTLEEENFFKTLEKGGTLLTQIISSSKGKISGEDAFKLKDTYGFPLEEILLIAKDAALTVDITRFEALEKEAKERSKGQRKVTHTEATTENLFQNIKEKVGATLFTGYLELVSEATIVAILKEDKPVTALYAGEEGLIILDKTPFYPEKGGQVGDSGFISSTEATFVTLECTQPYPDLILHRGLQREGTLKVGDLVSTRVDAPRRQKIANNHTATHLLHFALQQIVGPHIRQAGSLVDPERLRFDFSHHKQLSSKEIDDVEQLVNEKIRENKPVITYEKPFESIAKQSEIKQFFGEKYGAVVRVVDIDYSKELCGGTHTSATGTLGFFKILKESSIASGVRRLEAVTGEAAERLVRKKEEQLLAKIEALIEEKADIENQLKVSQQKILASVAEALLEQKEKNFIVAQVAVKELKELSDQLLVKCPHLALFLIAKVEGKLMVLVRASKELAALCPAHEWLKEVLIPLGGKGGGKSDMAQGSLPEENKAEELIVRARAWIAKRS